MASPAARLACRMPDSLTPKCAASSATVRPSATSRASSARSILGLRPAMSPPTRSPAGGSPPAHLPPPAERTFRAGRLAAARRRPVCGPRHSPGRKFPPTRFPFCRTHGIFSTGLLPSLCRDLDRPRPRPPVSGPRPRGPGVSGEACQPDGSDRQRAPRGRPLRARLPGEGRAAHQVRRVVRRARRRGDPQFKTGAWCDMFIAWAAHKAGVSEYVGTFAWTPSHARWFSTPPGLVGPAGAGSPGVLRLGGSKKISKIDHVGIVERVEGRPHPHDRGQRRQVWLKRKVRDESKVSGTACRAR